MRLVDGGVAHDRRLQLRRDGFYAIEDRCSHDDGPLCEGDWEPEACVVVCPRHGSRFDLESGIPMSLPAFAAVPIYPVSVREDGQVVVEVPDDA